MLQPYDINKKAVPLMPPQKRLQSWTSSLSASENGNKITYVQIEQSEDEIMMIDFK